MIVTFSPHCWEEITALKRNILLIGLFDPDKGGVLQEWDTIDWDQLLSVVDLKGFKVTLSTFFNDFSWSYWLLQIIDFISIESLHKIRL